MHEHPPSSGIIQQSAPYFNGTATATSHPVLAVGGRILCVRHCHAFGTGHVNPVGDTAVPTRLLSILF